MNVTVIVRIRVLVALNGTLGSTMIGDAKFPRRRPRNGTRPRSAKRSLREEQQ